jgi:hypothetical protein
MPHHRPVFTDRGYIGKWCHRAEIRNEDLVCILLGCPTPVVLRSVEEHYEYVGDIYVEGIMYGEAMDALDRREFRSKMLS